MKKRVTEGGDLSLYPKWEEMFMLNFPSRAEVKTRHHRKLGFTRHTAHKICSSRKLALCRADYLLA